MKIKLDITDCSSEKVEQTEDLIKAALSLNTKERIEIESVRTGNEMTVLPISDESNRLVTDAIVHFLKMALRAGDEEVCENPQKVIATIINDYTEIRYGQ